jgi:hypothetical protein
VQLAPHGNPLHARIDFFGGDHGDRVGIVSTSTAEFWWKAKNIRVVCDNKYVVDMALRRCTTMRALFDPKLAFEQLQADRAAGKVQVATKEPARQGEPITLTATSPGDPDRRHLYEVDPKTKLVQRVIEERRRGDQWKRAAQADYLEYNQQIDPKVFRPDLPKDISTVDTSKMLLNKMGVTEVTATRLAEECLEAVISGDYLKLTQLNDVGSATWKITSVIKSPGHGAETSAGTGMFLAPSHERMEKTAGGRQEIDIWDRQKDKAIRLVPAAKTAVVLESARPFPGGAWGKTFPHLRHLIESGRSGAGGYGERLGTRTVDGRNAEGFRFRLGSAEITIWADEKMSVPVRVEKVASVGDEEVRTVMTDFQINKKLDESLFALSNSRRCTKPAKTGGVADAVS